MRQSPNQSSTLFKIGTIKTGNDGNKWKVTKTVNGIKRWQKVTRKTSKKKSSRKTTKRLKKTSKKCKCPKNKTWDKKVRARSRELSNKRSTRSYVDKNKLTSKDRNYLIHDNGGRPFKVVVNNKGISIYKPKNEDELMANKHSKLITTIKKFNGYWSGYDSSPYKMNGNTILIKVSNHEYIYIGSEIYRFKTDDIMKDYVSPVGNNDVPHPVTYGEDNVYFMLDKKMIRNEDLETPIDVQNAEKLYGEFYGHLGSGKHRKYNMKNVKKIHNRL